MLKRGSRVTPHFAHRRGSECANRGESPKHLALKGVLWRAWRGVPWVASCELEYVLDCAAGVSRRADLLLTVVAGPVIAVEAQISPVEDEAIRQKVRDYAGLGISTLYILLPNVFSGYRTDAGLPGLDGYAVRVPAWVRTVRSLQSDPWSGERFLYVWEADALHLVGLDPVYRTRVWQGEEDVVELVSTSRIRYLGRLPAETPFLAAHTGGVIPAGISTLCADAGYLDAGWRDLEGPLVALSDVAAPLPDVEVSSAADPVVTRHALGCQVGGRPDLVRAERAARVALNRANRFPSATAAERHRYAVDLLSVASLYARALPASARRADRVQHCMEEEAERQRARQRHRRDAARAPCRNRLPAKPRPQCPGDHSEVPWCSLSETTERPWSLNRPKRQAASAQPDLFANAASRRGGEH
jgi:hypothetical protein